MNPDDPNYVPPVTPNEPEVPEVPEDAPETVEPEVQPDPEAPQTIEQLQDTNRKLFARAKRAEGFVLEDGKWVKKPKEPAPATSPKPTKEPSVEETVLLANGMPEELLAQLKKVAQVNGTTLLKAQTDPLFVAMKANFDKEQTRKAASLGAGRGAGAKTVEKTASTPGLSRDDHKDLFYKKVRG